MRLVIFGALPPKSKKGWEEKEQCNNSCIPFVLQYPQSSRASHRQCCLFHQNNLQCKTFIASRSSRWSHVTLKLKPQRLVLLCCTCMATTCDVFLQPASRDSGGDSAWCQLLSGEAPFDALIDLFLFDVIIIPNLPLNLNSITKNSDLVLCGCHHHLLLQG